MEEATKTACEHCGGTGWQIIQEGAVPRAKRCSCQQMVNSDKVFSSAKIPIRYQSCEFENYLPLHASQSRAKKILTDYASDFPALDDDFFHEPSLLFTGGAGRGKTHLAVAVLKSLLQKGVPCLFVDFHELLSEIRNSYDPLAQTSEFQILRPILNVEVLLLDDLGSQRMSEWVQDTVFNIINLRYSQKKVLIATTNLRMEPDKDSRFETLQDRLGYPVVSRLYEMCTTIEIAGGDYRKDVRKAGRDFLGNREPGA